MAEAAKDLRSTDPVAVIKGLNTILVKSADMDPSRLLELEQYPDVASALGDLLDVINPIGGMATTSITSNYGLKRKLEEDTMKYKAIMLKEETKFLPWLTELPVAGNQLFKVIK